MRIPIALSTLLVLAACAQPYADGRLAPKGVPLLSTAAPAGSAGSAGATGEASDAAVAAATATSLAPVPDAPVTAAAVLPFVENLRRQHGDAGLRTLPPGTTLAERLQYCTAQVMLSQSAQVLPELIRLARAHPDRPLVWRQLGLAQMLLEHQGEADAAMRQAYRLSREESFATCPFLPTEFGVFLLQQESTRSEGMALLRAELASGQDFRNAAQVLATELRRNEDHASAIACVEAARKRAPDDVTLQVLRADLGVDVHDPDTAVALLESLAEQPNPDPLVLDVLRRARVLRREFVAAVAILDRELGRDGMSKELRKHLLAGRDALTDAAKTGVQDRVGEWEVYAILRGHSDLALRRRVLDSAVRSGNARLRDGALRIAFLSDSPVLRSAALAILLPRSTDPLGHLRAGFEDADGTVRATAATLASSQADDRGRAAELVLEFMAAETDAYAFRQMHAAMVELTGRQVELPFGAVKDAAMRRVVVEGWRKSR